MMHSFLSNNRDELIDRCRGKVLQRPHRSATAEQLSNGIPLFLNQLIRTLVVEQSANRSDSVSISGPPGGDTTALSEIGVSAAAHGGMLLRLGFSVDQVVHDYGDLCQAVTDLAFERDAPFAVDEFRTLNRCLDNAIADAVTEFSRQRDSKIAEQYASDEEERSATFKHELRNQLQVAVYAYAAISAGSLPVNGATGAVLGRSLDSVASLVNRSIDEIKVATRGIANFVLFSAAEFVDQMSENAMLSANRQGGRFQSAPVAAGLAFLADRDLLTSAVANLLQNAFKFSKQNGMVALNVYATDETIFIDVQDSGGGLAPGIAETLFRPFSQGGINQTGLGLGLTIAKRAVELNHGTHAVISDSDGCIFTITLPRHALIN